MNMSATGILHTMTISLNIEELLKEAFERWKTYSQVSLRTGINKSTLLRHRKPVTGKALKPHEQTIWKLIKALNAGKPDAH